MPVTDAHNPLSFSTDWTRRGWLAAALAVAVTPAWVRALPAVPRRILFVCQAGTVKSPMARELFRDAARRRGIAIDAFSRGLAIVDHVSPDLRLRLTADHIDVSAEPAQLLASTDWQAALLVVAFNPLPAAVDRSDIIDWTDVGSMNYDYDRSLADLRNRINGLLDMLIQRGVSSLAHPPSH